jgi:hypothetical protein
MRKIWVFLLAAVALVVGGFGALVYGGFSGSFAGIRIGCELLETAEGSSILDKTQRADVVERVLQAMRKGAGTDSKAVQLLEEMKTGCPKLTG